MKLRKYSAVAGKRKGMHWFGVITIKMFRLPGAGMTVSTWFWSSLSLSPESTIFTTAVYLSRTSYSRRWTAVNITGLCSQAHKHTSQKIFTKRYHNNGLLLMVPLSQSLGNDFDHDVGLQPVICSDWLLLLVFHLNKGLHSLTANAFTHTHTMKTGENNLIPQWSPPRQISSSSPLWSPNWRKLLFSWSMVLL